VTDKAGEGKGRVPFGGATAICPKRAGQGLSSDLPRFRPKSSSHGARRQVRGVHLPYVRAAPAVSEAGRRQGSGSLGLTPGQPNPAQQEEGICCVGGL
jgi:hypothetical protein